MQQVRTPRAQLLLVHISIELLLMEVKAGSEVSSNEHLSCSCICSTLLPGVPKAPTACSHGGPLLSGVEAPLLPGCLLPTSPQHPASHPCQPCSQPPHHIQSLQPARAQRSGRAGTVLGPSITCTETIPVTSLFIGRVDL